MDRDFVLGVDLDGVVADFISGLHPIAAEWCGVDPRELTLDVSYGFREWNLERFGPYDNLQRFALKERDLFRNLNPVAGAGPALRRISTHKDIRIRIITHRLYFEWFHEQAIVQTAEWLEKHAIPYWDLCFMKTKSAVEADVYLEDSPDNIRDLRTRGKEVIVAYNSTNRRIEKPGADNWDDIEKLVLDSYHRWKDRAC